MNNAKKGIKMNILDTILENYSVELYRDNHTYIIHISNGIYAEGETLERAIEKAKTELDTISQQSGY